MTKVDEAGGMVFGGLDAVVAQEPKATDWAKCRECAGQGEDEHGDLCANCGGSGQTSDHPAAVQPVNKKSQDTRLRVRDPEKLREYRARHRAKSVSSAKAGPKTSKRKVAATPLAKKSKGKPTAIRKQKHAISYVRAARSPSSYPTGHHTPYTYGPDSRSVTKVIRMSEEEAKAIGRLAKKAGMSFSHYVRESCLGRV